MTLRRSSSALFSMHVFYKADVIVFCEGGQPKSVSDALSYSSENRTLDNIFWSSMLEFAEIGKKLHFKSIGSKPTLTSIAKDIQENGITTISLCMDSDYDGIIGTKLEHDRISYTHGYSWESDVMSRESLKEVLVTLVGKVSDEHLEELENNLVFIEENLVKWCEIDISLKKKNKPCVFDRKSPLFPIDQSKSPVEVCESRLKTRLEEVCGYKTRPHRVYRVRCTEVSRLVFGKLVSKYSYLIILQIAKKYINNIRVDYDTFMKLAISATHRLIRSAMKVELLAHYSSLGRAF